MMQLTSTTALCGWVDYGDCLLQEYRSQLYSEKIWKPLSSIVLLQQQVIHVLALSHHLSVSMFVSVCLYVCLPVFLSVSRSLSFCNPTITIQY